MAVMPSGLAVMSQMHFFTVRFVIIPSCDSTAVDEFLQLSVRLLIRFNSPEKYFLISDVFPT